MIMPPQASHKQTRGSSHHSESHAPGVSRHVRLPNDEFDVLWKSIFLPEGLKDQLLNQAVLNFTLRQKESPKLPLHGIIVLQGPPGTGKTTLARGVASQVARAFNRNDFSFIEVDPHALGSSALGKTQRAVTDLFSTTIAEAAMTGPTIVLLDEVETLAAARQRLSLEANPIDVHRATDAVLTQVDALAHQHANVLFLATSNFIEALDTAFLSRADLVLHIGLPSDEARQDIIRDTLDELARLYPEIRKLLGKPLIEQLTAASSGFDGRQVRKAMIASLALSREVALDPNCLSGDMIQRAFAAAGRQLKGASK